MSFSHKASPCNEPCRPSDTTGDPGFDQLVRHLRTGYRAEIPAMVWRAPRSLPDDRPASTMPHHRLYTRAPARTLSSRWLRRLSLAVAVATIATGAVLAAGSLVNLGKPTTDVPRSTFPVGGFRKAKDNLQENHLPVLLFMGTALDGGSAAERWPIIKSLSRFGAWHGVKQALGVPTYDLSRATLQSKYVRFREIDLIDVHNRVRVSKLSSADRRLYDRYAHVRASSNEYDNIMDSLSGQIEPAACGIQNCPLPKSTGNRHLPLILIGGYIQTISQMVTVGDVQMTPPPTTGPGGSVTYSTTYIPFDILRKALATHRLPPAANGSRYSADSLYDINAEANLITAMVCHATQGQPKSVCGGKTIATILRHLHR